MYIWYIYIYIYYRYIYIYMIITYDDHIWSSYIILIYNLHIWSSHMIIIYNPHIWWSYMMPLIFRPQNHHPPCYQTQLSYSLQIVGCILRMVDNQYTCLKGRPIMPSRINKNLKKIEKGHKWSPDACFRWSDKIKMPFRSFPDVLDKYFAVEQNLITEGPRWGPRH